MDSKFLSRCRFVLAVVLLARSERLPDAEAPKAKAEVLRAAIDKQLTGIANFNSQKKVATSLSESSSKAYVDEFTDHGESFAVLHRAFIVKNKKTTNKPGVDAAKQKKRKKKTAKNKKTAKAATGERDDAIEEAPTDDESGTSDDRTAETSFDDTPEAESDGDVSNAATSESDDLIEEVPTDSETGGGTSDDPTPGSDDTPESESDSDVLKANASDAVVLTLGEKTEADQTTGVMNYANFVALATKMKWDVVNKGALERIFKSMAGGSDLCPGEGVVTCPVSQKAFANACVTGPHNEFVSTLFLAFYNDQVRCPDRGECQNAASAGEAIEHDVPDMSVFVDEFRKLERVGPCWPSCFREKAAYNFSLSTKENYKGGASPTNSIVDEGRGGEFSGKFGSIRATRDSKYHGHYTYVRSFWQDEWVSKVTQRAPAHVKDPWLIFLAGGMASGKGHVLEYLTNHGYLGLENTVYINPDYFKSIMPEYDKYRSAGEEEGNKFDQESGYIEELALWEALRRGSHIVEDGSLRDTTLFAGGSGRLGLISLIKEKYPMYRVAVLWTDLVYEGVDSKDGHLSALVRSGLEGVAQCAEAVKKLVKDSVVDFAVRIDNSKSQPKVVSVAGTNGVWSDPNNPEDPNKVILEKLGPAALAKVTAEEIKNKGELDSGRGVGLSLEDSIQRTNDFQNAVKTAWPTLLDYFSGALPRDETVPGGVADSWQE